jgi:hypothetical protein
MREETTRGFVESMQSAFLCSAQSPFLRKEYHWSGPLFGLPQFFLEQIYPFALVANRPLF